MFEFKASIDFNNYDELLFKLNVYVFTVSVGTHNFYYKDQ